MKYTRYDYRRKKEDKVSVIVVFLSIVLAAALLGTALSSIFLKNTANTGQVNEKVNDVSNTKNTEKVDKTNNTNSGNEAVNSTSASFVFIQNGYYKNKANAVEQKGKINGEINPFMVEEDGAFRVFYGIFNEAEYEGVVKKITDKGLPKARITYEILAEDQATIVICNILKGHLQHLTKLTEGNVAAVKTDKFKKWLAELSKVDESSKSYALLEEYRGYVNSLPEEIERDKVEENYTYIYNIIKKIGQKKQ